MKKQIQTLQNRYFSLQSSRIKYSFIAILLCIISSSLYAVNDSYIKGTVIDQETKKPIKSVTVTIPELRLGSLTDEKGNFMFDAPAGDHNVEIRMIGYGKVTKQVNLGKGKTAEIKVEISTKSFMMDEVVVTGLSGDVDRNKLGNSVTTLNNDEIKNVASNSPLDALSGKITGATVTKSTGTPGAGTFVTLRGRKSIMGSSEPIYVIDGVLIDNSSGYDQNGSHSYSNRAIDINPADIENIEVLKGASAAALYGSQAANGVILITTKRGKLTGFEKPAQVTYSAFASEDVQSGTYPLQTKFGQTKAYQPGVPGTSTSWGAALPSGTKVYDHSGDIFRTAMGGEHSLTVSGGVPQFDYLLNGTTNNTEGYVIGSNYIRNSVRANIGASILSNLSIRNNANFISIDNDMPQDGSNRSGILLGSLRTSPEFDNSVYLEPDGSQRRYAGYDNPIWTQHYNTYNSKVTRFINSTEIKYNLFDKVFFKALYGIDSYSQTDIERLAVGSAGSANREGSITQGRTNSNKQNFDFTANYVLKALDNDLIVNLLAGSQAIWYNTDASRANSITTLSFFNEVPSGSAKDASSSRTETKVVGYFSQVTASYLDRYNITGAIRRDGSSTFGESEKYHYYPKVSFAYNLGHEGFMKSTKSFMDNIRLRGSWGQAGSPSLPSAYITNNLYGTAGFFDNWGRTTGSSRGGFIGIRQGGYGSDSYIIGGNKNILPERTTEFETGLDITLFENFLSLEATYYHQNVSDMIINAPVASSTGYDQILKNGGEMWNSGIELSLRANINLSSDMSWSSIINYTTFKNQVTKLAINPDEAKNKDAYLGLTGGFTGITNVAMVGQPLGVFMGHGWLREDNGNRFYSGDYVKVDADGNWVRTANGNVVRASKGDANSAVLVDDQGNDYIGAPIKDTKLKIIGNPNPDFAFSWRNEFIIMRNLRISFLIDAVYGFDIWNGTRGALYNFGAHKNTEDRNDVWVNERGETVKDATGKAVTRQDYYQVYANGFNDMEEAHIEKGSYIKLRELSLSYDWNVLKDWDISNLRITFSARNLLTITKYTGFDPEVNTFSLAEGRGFDYFVLPQVHSYRLGITINY